MKVRIVLVSLLFISIILTGCGKKGTDNNPTTAPTAAPTSAPTAVATQAPGDNAAGISPAATPATDVVTTASIVNTEEAFLKAISTTGTWIIAITEDMTTDKELVLEGDFKNGKQDDSGADIIQRKIALYAQDENRVVTARYKLTAPKITIKSPKASIQKGIFIGDVYVDVADFELVDQEVQGNVYFTKQEYMDSFVMDETSKISGTKGLVQP